MTDEASLRERPIVWYAAGALLVVLAIVLYSIDADPAFLFQAPVTSLVIVAAGALVAYVGYQRSRKRDAA